MRKIILSSLIFAVCLGGLCSCEDELEDADIAQFNQPRNVTFVCYDLKDGPQPIEKCRNNQRLNAEIYAFVTQTEYGEVAVVNMEDYEVIDQEERIPFKSFVAVGGVPLDITTSADGKHVYTANNATNDISVIPVDAAIKAAKTGTNSLAKKPIFIGNPAEQIIIASDVNASQHSENSTQDKYAFVTVPALGRVVVVHLGGDTVIDDSGNKVELPKGVMGWVRFDSTVLEDDVKMTDGRPEGVAPRAMVASKKMASLFVGASQETLEGNQTGYVVELQRDVFIERAKTAYMVNGAATSLNLSEIMIRKMDLNGFTVQDMSIEPELERWIYIAEKQLHGVIVLDLQTGELVRVNDWDETNDQKYSIEVPGMIKNVKMLRVSETLNEDELPDRLTFNGTFALASTTIGSFYVIDVSIDDEFADLIDDYSMYTHSLRSNSGWYVDEEEEDAKYLYPSLDGEPELLGDDDVITAETPFKNLLVADEAVDTDTATDSNTDTANLPNKNTDSDTTAVDPCDNDPSGFRVVETEDSYNVYFRCDRRHTVTEDWKLEYEGSVGVSGTGIFDLTNSVIDPNDTDSAPPTLFRYIAIKDEYKRYCESGVLSADKDGNLWGYDTDPADTDSPIPDVRKRFRDYKGDIVEITSFPSPFNNSANVKTTNCSIFENDEIKKQYRIVKILDQQTLLIEKINRPGYAPLPYKECFEEAFQYTIRAGESWVLRGNGTPYMTEGSQMDNGHCVPWEQENSVPWKTSRVFAGVPFENQKIKFSLEETPEVKKQIESGEFDVLKYEFSTVDGFEPMAYSAGKSITDIQIAPNNDVVLIDQSSSSMYVFDLLDSFMLKTDPIN